MNSYHHQSQLTLYSIISLSILFFVVIYYPVTTLAATVTQHDALQEIEVTAITSVLEELPSSLRGSTEHSQLKLIREKLRLLKNTSDATPSLMQLDDELPLNDASEFYSQWSSLSDEELSILSHDSSFLNRRQHHVLSAAYLSRRKTSVSITPLQSVGGLLRGSPLREHGRKLAMWTTHGDVNEPPPGLIFDGEVVYNKPEIQESVVQENNKFLLMGYQMEINSSEKEDEKEDAEIQDLYKRLHEAMEVTKALDEKYTNYDTNPMYTYSNPSADPNTGVVDDMVQHSALGSKRQRLLTGSYAVWQWYDRNNLAKPENMDFNKLSRVNYAFFQTDADGYIFGTDSWADPNVLFGPYDFSVNIDKLTPECKGGRGRDDGKPVNATVDQTAIYTEQQQGGGGTRRFGSNAKPSNRRTQNTQNIDSGGGSFQYPDYTKDIPCEFFESCHRNFPNSKTCNTHKFKEGLIYRAHTSGAQVYPSIGGWTLSNSFPIVASDPKKRLRFARECVGLIADYGFDGIDIDWEYPGYKPHGGSEVDRKNFNELLLAIRVALNEYQTQTGDAPIGGGAFGLTAALPCGPANINFLDVNFLSEVLNGMNLMTFDFHSAQEPITGVASPLYDQGWGENGLSVDSCVKNYYKSAVGLVANKISIGVPFYGKTYEYATDLNAPHSNTNGLFSGNADQANWPKDLGTPVFYNMLDAMIKGRMVCKRHEATKSAYAYFKDGSGLVTYDDPQAVCNKAEYVNTNLLGGLFIWELSGDLLDTLTTPLLDAINRKLEEINFDCAVLKVEEDCSVPELPPPSAKGEAQVEVLTVNTTESILEYLRKAEAGELTSDGRGYGAFTRVAFMMRAYDGSLFPSYNYRYDDFVDALAVMTVTGIDGETFYVGEPENGKTARYLQGENSTKKGTSLVPGLVNIAAFLAQAMTESIIHDACDEFNAQPLPNSTDDGIGLDDGIDHFRFPISNACGQNGRSYQDEQCNRPEDRMYDCTTQLNSEEFASMEITAFSQSRWPGSPGPLYCGPKTIYKETGFWDAAIGKENETVPLANDEGRTDVEGCCFWGRGCLLSVKGTCLLGKLNYHIGANKARREGESNAMFPDVDFCLEPYQICAGVHSPKLRWITGLYHWIENVQSYNEDGFNYMDELDIYIGDNLEDENFFLMVTRIHLFGCHLESCSSEIHDMDSRIRNFEKVLSVLNLQFTSHAKAEPPFKTFPGQVPPTRPPVAATGTKTPTSSPISTIENVVTQVRMFLTGVPPEVNMSNSELNVFDTLMLELLVPRLKTANVDVTAVKTVQQKPGADFIAESSFNSPASNIDESVLEVILNVTLTYYPPEPDGWRDWSIYLKSWIESFGTTLVDIFTSPKNPQHPETNSKFWDKLADVSASNVPPGGLVPKEIPTPPPTYIFYPEPSATNQAIMGMGIGVGSLAFCIFVLFGCYVYRKIKQEKTKGEKINYGDDISYGFSKTSSYDSRSRSRRTRGSQVGGSEYNQRVFDKLLDGIHEASESDSSSSSSSSESSSDNSVEDGDGSSSSSDSSNSSSSSDSSNSSSSSSEKPRKRTPTLKMTYPQAYPPSTSTRSHPTTASNSEASASVSTSYGSDSQTYHTDSRQSQASISISKASEHQSYMSDTISNATDSMSRSRATESIHSADDEREEYLDYVRRTAANDPVLKMIALDNKSEIGCNDQGDRLWTALVNNQFVECLSLRNSNLSDTQISALSIALMDNKSISRIWLEDNNISSDGAEYLLSAVESNHRISEIKLEGNHIDSNLIHDINSILEGASVTTNSRDNLGLLVEQILNNDPSLQELNLPEMNIGTRSDVLFDALTSNTYVRTLNLASNEIDDDVISSLSVALMDNTSIKYINLSDNFLTSEGAEYLIDLLNSNNTIQRIDLGGNEDIDDRIVKNIDDLLSRRRFPSSPSVSSSLATENPLAGIVQSLQANDPSLVELCLDNVDLTDYPETEVMLDALVGNTVVKRLSLINTCFDDALAATLSLSLVENSSITHILLSNNLVTDEGCDYLLGTLDSNTTVVCLDLDDNYIDDKLLAEMETILSERRANIGHSMRATQINDAFDRSSTAGSMSSASVSMVSRVSSVASSFMRTGGKRRDTKASAKISEKEIV